MFRREIHYFICTNRGYRNERIVITDPEHEKHVINLIAQEKIEFDVNDFNKNEFYFQRYELGKPVRWFNWKTKIYSQESFNF